MPSKAHILLFTAAILGCVYYLTFPWDYILTACTTVPAVVLFRLRHQFEKKNNNAHS